MGSVGRPTKYRPIFEALDEEEIYTPATIAALAEENGFIQGQEEERRLNKLRIRIAAGRRSNLYKFPDEGDGMVTIRGQAPCPGWFGWRWKETMSR